MKPLVIIPCGKAKVPEISQAQDLYIGDLFRKVMVCARMLTEPSEIRILSAKHGLLRLEDEVEPYDLKMGKQGCVRAGLIRRQANEQGIASRVAVIGFGGEPYRKVIQEVWRSAIFPVMPGRGTGTYKVALNTYAERLRTNVPD